MMSNIYQLAKQFHRFVLFITVFLGIIMMGTGIVLKYSFIATRFQLLDLGLMRYLHNTFSLFFSIALSFMILTGLLLYFLPVLIRRKAVSSQVPPEQK
jgi:hypothetical protein